MNLDFICWFSPLRCSHQYINMFVNQFVFVAPDPPIRRYQPIKAIDMSHLAGNTQYASKGCQPHRVCMGGRFEMRPQGQYYMLLLGCKFCNSSFRLSKKLKEMMSPEVLSEGVFLIKNLYVRKRE